MAWAYFKFSNKEGKNLMYKLRKSGWISQAGYKYKTKAPIQRTIKTANANHIIGLKINKLPCFYKVKESIAANPNEIVTSPYIKEARFIYLGSEYYICQSVVLDKGPFIPKHLQNTLKYFVYCEIDNSKITFEKLRQIFND